MCLLLWACSPADDTGSDDAPLTPDATLARDQIDWLSELLNGPADAIGAERVTPHFEARFLAQVPPDELAQGLKDMAAQIAPFSVTSTIDAADGSAVAVLQSDNQMLFRLKVLAFAPSGLIGALLLEPAPDLDPGVADFDGLSERLGESAPRTAALIASVDSTGCTALHATDADVALPIASASKLYVLGALVARIERGEARWEDLLTIREDWSSLVPGEFEALLGTTPQPLSTYADAMMALSDNTATDHLIHLLGREAIEAQQGAMGHTAPELNAPFFTTRDLFTLKLALGPEERQAYIDASVTERKRLVEEVYPAVPRPADLDQRMAEWTGPRSVDSLEWFASASDLCRAFSWLKEAADRGPGARAMQSLALNTGVGVDVSTFRYVGFDGGSEPGVLSGTWLLQRRRDAAFRVVSVMASDAERPLKELRLHYLSLAAIQLAGRE
jgi:beta-lactamase class A